MNPNANNVVKSAAVWTAKFLSLKVRGIMIANGKDNEIAASFKKIADLFIVILIRRYCPKSAGKFMNKSKNSVSIIHNENIAQPRKNIGLIGVDNLIIAITNIKIDNDCISLSFVLRNLPPHQT